MTFGDIEKWWKLKNAVSGTLKALLLTFIKETLTKSVLMLDDKECEGFTSFICVWATLDCSWTPLGQLKFTIRILNFHDFYELW